MTRKEHYIDRAYSTGLGVAFGLPMAMAAGLVGIATFRSVPDWAVFGGFFVGTAWLCWWLWYGFRCIDKAFEHK